MKLAILAVGAALSFAPALPAAAQEPGVDFLGLVSRFGAAINRDDVEAISALCTEDAVVIDDFAPYVWPGPKACAVWARAHRDRLQANVAAGKPANASDVTLGSPWRIKISDEMAYVVLPARYAHAESGAKGDMTAVWTLALRHTPEGWRVAGWALGQAPAKAP